MEAGQTLIVLDDTRPRASLESAGGAVAFGRGAQRAAGGRARRDRHPLAAGVAGLGRDGLRRRRGARHAAADLRGARGLAGQPGRHPRPPDRAVARAGGGDCAREPPRSTARSPCWTRGWPRSSAPCSWAWSRSTSGSWACSAIGTGAAGERARTVSEIARIDPRRRRDRAVDRRVAQPPAGRGDGGAARGGDGALGPARAGRGGPRRRGPHPHHGPGGRASCWGCGSSPRGAWSSPGSR